VNHLGKGFESRLVKTNFEIKAEEENSKKLLAMQLYLMTQLQKHGALLKK